MDDEGIKSNLLSEQRGRERNPQGRAGGLLTEVLGLLC